METENYPREARAIIEAEIKGKDLRQKDFAKATGIPAATLSMFLSGQRKPSIPLLEKCAEELELNLDDLIQSQKDFEIWARTPEGKRVLSKEQRLNSTDTQYRGTLVNWQIRLHLDLSELQMKDGKSAEIKLASLDLTRGKFKIVSRDLGRTYSDKDVLELRSGDSALVYSKQKLTLPSFLAGRAGGISFFVRHGITVTFGLQLDPLFSGHPFALFSNNSAESYTIAPDEPCLSVEFYYLAAEPDQDFEETSAE